MGRAIRFHLSRRARLTLAKLDRVLDSFYGAPEAELDNKADPLEEAIYIILSFQTDLGRFKRVWTRLRQEFPSWDDLDRARLRNVVRVLELGGLQDQKARAIKRLLKAIMAKTGDFSLEWLREMNNEEAEFALTKLPGLSLKGARCVLLYSLDRAVFPVDGNTFRILKRVGILPASSVYRRRALHDVLQKAVEAARRKPFHVNLVVHGQRTCLPHRPRCCDCPARSLCAMRGVSRDVSMRARHRGQDVSGVAAASDKRARA